MRTKNWIGFMAAGICAAGFWGFITSATAIGITTGFGTIPGASGNPYSGSGIPFNTSEYTVVSGIPTASALHQDTLTIAMAATQHGSVNPAPGNNGAGTYTVGTGLVSGRSVWNFDFYANSALGNVRAYSYTLTELNVGNGQSFSFDPMLISDNVGGPASAGNSESLDFATFGLPLAYNPTLNDTYQFTLDAYLNGNQIGQTAITVVSGTGAPNVPDSGSTAGMFGVGLIGLLALKSKAVLSAIGVA